MAQDRCNVLMNLPMWALVRRDCVDQHEFVIHSELSWNADAAADMQRQVAEDNPIWDRRCPVVRVVPVKVVVHELNEGS